MTGVTGLDLGTQALTCPRKRGNFTILENLRVEIDADKATGADFRIGFHITDREATYGYHVRNGIAAFYTEIPEEPHLVLHLPSEAVYDFVLGRRGIRQVLDAGEGSAEGNLDLLTNFAGFFDFTKSDIQLASR